MLYVHIPLISLHKYRSVYENNILFRKPPLVGPPLSCAHYEPWPCRPRSLHATRRQDRKGDAGIIIVIISCIIVITIIIIIGIIIAIY